jgi:hypothetical protein
VLQALPRPAFLFLDHLTVLARCQVSFTGILAYRAGTVYYLRVDEELIRKVRSELARQGGLARAKALTPKQRRDSAIKASKAAAKVRMKKAKAKKQGKSGSKET